MKILLAVSLLAVAANAQTFAQFQAFVDPKCTNLFQRIAIAQTNFFQANGRLAQAHFSHTFYPSNNINAVANNTNVVPTLGVAWRDFNSITSSLPMRCQVNVYNGPQGWGWQARFQAIWRSTNYAERVMQMGPETWRAHDWRRSIPTNNIGE